MRQTLATPFGAGAVAPETSNAPARLDYLDGLRALAALYVVLHHAWMTIWPVEYYKHPVGVLAAATSWLAYGHFAVSAFIVISGFCLMLPVARSGVLKGGARRFFKKRARRILPPYYFALGISALLAITIIAQPTGTHWDVSLPVSFPALWAHVILLQDVVYPSQINHVMWSIAVEWQIYFLFPVLVALWRRAGATTVTLGALVVAYAVYFGFKWLGIIPPNGESAIVPQYVGLFALGMCGAALISGSSGRSRRLVRRIPWTPLAISALVLVCMLNTLYSAFDPAYSDIFIGIATMCALIGASWERRDPLRLIFSWRPLVFVGTMSYSLYLIHAPLLQVLWQYALRPWHLPDGVAFVALIAGVSLIVALAYLFFLACERPFLTSPPPLHPWVARLAAMLSVVGFVPQRKYGVSVAALPVDNEVGR